ncbi:uncharacterized protein SCHCODRAFT_02668091 [Schizophyllum commune H4-8]|nr:uncharacterized protein SCHCODRAFT_02668091 [Schizophyllum commune H4-8]KAI5892668.1 hypothetical protein SCHCODRAFT_02668091 [Schizophyllum commune H4-8]
MEATEPSQVPSAPHSSTLADALLDAVVDETIDHQIAIELAHALLRGALIKVQAQMEANCLPFNSHNADNTVKHVDTMLRLLKTEDGQENSWLNRLKARLSAESRNQ